MLPPMERFAIGQPVRFLQHWFTSISDTFEYCTDQLLAIFFSPDSAADDASTFLSAASDLESQPPQVLPIEVVFGFGLYSRQSSAEAEAAIKVTAASIAADKHLRDIGCTTLFVRTGPHISDDPRKHWTVDKLDILGQKIGHSMHVYATGLPLYTLSKRRKSSTSQ